MERERGITGTTLGSLFQPRTEHRGSEGPDSEVSGLIQVPAGCATFITRPYSMIHEHTGKNYLLNLIDTPGHVDFAWEVSRSLAACQGALLLVDASQGVQAQSLSVFHAARERGLTIIPVLNKVNPVANMLSLS